MTHEFALWLRDLVLAGEPLVFFHVPNESFTSVTFSVKLNSMGRISGAPDFVITTKENTIYIELKAKSSRGTLSPNQKAFQSWCELAEVPYYVASSLEEAQNIVREQLLPDSLLA